MAEFSNDLGRLISVHSTAPIFLQRAAIVAMVSFTFFLAMLIAFYVRHHFGYFLLSTAFLVVYLFTMIGWWIQKRNILKIYENGLSYKKFASTWEAVAAFEEIADRNGLITLTLTDQKKRSVVIPPTLDRAEWVAQIVRINVSAH